MRVPMETLSQKGFSAIIAIVAVIVISGLGAGGWYIWKNNQSTDGPDKANGQAQKQEDTTSGAPVKKDETTDWVSITTQAKKFSMKVPDGWEMTSYPGDYIGTVNTVYKPGTPAMITTATSEYAGHSLRFRASIAPLNDAGLGPQWSSPQPDLNETSQSFSLGGLQGKRFKAVFSNNLNQTIYEYIFDVGNNQRLDIVYAVYGSQDEKDNVEIVEKAIRTITLN